MQKKIAWSSLKAGIVISLALVLFFMTVFFSGAIVGAFSPTEALYAHFANVHGLRTGSPVWLFGVEVGSVESIRITDQGALVGLRVRRERLAIVNRDATVRVQTMGLLGDKYVEILPGTVGLGRIAPGDTVSSEQMLELSDLLNQSISMLERVSDISVKMDSLLGMVVAGDGTLGKMVRDTALYTNLNRSARLFSSILNEWQRSEGTLKLLVRDSTLHQNMMGTVSRAATLLDSVHAGRGFAGELTHDGELVDRTRKILENLNDLIIDVKQNPKRYFTLKIF